MYEITQDELRAKIRYDETSGLFHRHNGRVAGCLRADKRREVTIDFISYRADRLAWFYVHGVWPWKVEHIDGDKRNNAIDNLRAIEKPEQEPKKPRKERVYQNKTGFRGVSVLHVGDGATKYGARRYIDGKVWFLEIGRAHV